MGLKKIGIASGYVDLQAACEQCDCVFQYRIKRYGLSSGFTRGRAMRNAQQDVEQSLETADGVAACPECGHYQGYMVANVRRFWIMLIAVLAFFVGVIWYFLGVLADANRDDAEAIRAVQLLFLIAGAGVWAFAVMMLVAGNPNKVAFLRKFYRRRARAVKSGRGAKASAASVEGESLAVESSPAGPDAPADWFLREEKTRVQCDQCGKRYSIPAEKVGAKVRCKCGQVFQA